MSWPQPTAQYGQTPWVTVAPRSRDAFFTVSRLYGWGLEATGRLDIRVSLSRLNGLHDDPFGYCRSSPAELTALLVSRRGGRRRTRRGCAFQGALVATQSCASPRRCHSAACPEQRPRVDVRYRRTAAPSKAVRRA